MKSNNPITLFEVMKMAKNLDKMAKEVNPKMSFRVNIPIPSQNCMSVTVSLEDDHDETWCIGECDNPNEFYRKFREAVNHAISRMCGECHMQKDYLDSLRKNLLLKQFKLED